MIETGSIIEGFIVNLFSILKILPSHSAKYSLQGFLFFMQINFYSVLCHWECSYECFILTFAQHWKFKNILSWYQSHCEEHRKSLFEKYVFEIFLNLIFICLEIGTLMFTHVRPKLWLIELTAVKCLDKIKYLNILLIIIGKLKTNFNKDLHK